jgi:hypothetical protein
MTTPIATLALKCAVAGLTRRQALDLFDALYMADALMLAKGNRVRAPARIVWAAG